MDSWLLFLLKSTLVLSSLYLFFRLIMRNETIFRISRTVLISIVAASFIIPFVYLPGVDHQFAQISLDPVFQDKTIIERPGQIDENTGIAFLPNTNTEINTIKRGSIIISLNTVLVFTYLAGVFISFLVFVYRVLSVMMLFKNARKVTLFGVRVWIHNDDIPAFSFGRRVLISSDDHDTNAEEILTHEMAHISQGHFYDLMLMELIKIIYWFNPLVYRMCNDLKDIHEFQADENTVNSGIDPTKYQLIIIQKCVGQQSFTLANSFNHCQIKKRITMMNKSKTNKAWCWKVATFLPLLALMLMAFGKRDKPVIQNSNLPVFAVALSEPVQKQYEQFKRKIEIRKDGNYINNKLYSLDEIATTGKEWYKASNDWILLVVDESVPLSRVDEVRGKLKDYLVVQTIADSDDLVYFAGNVNSMAKFKGGKFGDWINKQLTNYPKGIFKARDYAVTFSLIIDRRGKVKEGHIINGCEYPEINAAYEKLLTQIPDWEPAKKSGEDVSVYFRMTSSQKSYIPPKNK